MSFYDPAYDEPDDEPDIDEDDESAGPRFDDEVGKMAEQLVEARKIIAALLYPNYDDAADGVSVAEVWRKKAREFVGVKRIGLDPRIVNDVWSGARKFAIVPATGPAVAPRFHPPPAAVEGDTVELYFNGMIQVVKVTRTQTLSMEIHPSSFPGQSPVAWTQCGRDMAAFPLYEAEEVDLDKMDGWTDRAARFAHYCPDGKRFDGHIIFWSAP